ncbi:MAG TPA: BTAD domain-containing putative transcriptional regulator [Jatrophihabitans sp.]|nr:BTAD domain-containing putative transcriptional regulator [Jatrophihabitans sp.]
MQIAILGPLEVRDGAGRPVEVAGARVRTLLIRLALDAGRPVPVRTLVDAVWGDSPPAEETNALQTLVSRLRRTLKNPHAIVQSQAGYRLAADPADVDAHRFEQLARDGARALQNGQHREAGRLLADAVALWRGPALADATGDAFAVAAARLEDLKLAAVLDRVDADLELADPANLVPELEALAAEYPLHERLAGQLLRALGGSGRQAEALHSYERLRARLADELGVDPSPELQQIHLALLRGELGARPSKATRRTNLKAQLTSFVGREDEVARIGKTLEEHRLVTLVGPGGAGKTRLAAEAAAQAVDTAADGVWMVELAQVTTGADVPQAVLGSLELRESHLLERRGKLSARDAMTRLREGLVDACAVLILDNCEHVIEAAARLADHLLAECPDLRILATSREPLGIVGEVLLAVPPLGQPAPTAKAAEALEYPAVRLFADRAAAVRPDFEVADDNVAAAIEIVRRLDGLPLAIELAAARLRTLPIDEVAARLDDRFRLLTGGSRTALPRHRTLRAVVEWSWDLLDEDERRLAEQLAIFPSGVTAASASAVCDVPDAADLLASLIDKSLLQPIDGGRRMRMLETIREYGAERLAERGELVQLRARHAEYFVDLLEQAGDHLTTADQLPWFALLRDEHENVLAALRYYCDAGDADSALRIAVGLSTYAMMLGNHSEISSWLTDALAVPGGTDRQLRLIGRALHGLNSAASGGTSGEVAVTQLGELAQELTELDVAAHPMVGLLCVAVAFFAADSELTDYFIARTLEGGDDWARAAVRMFRANLAENSGDVETMRAETDGALAEFRRLGERWGAASTLRGQAQLYALDGRLDEAVEAYLEGLQLQGELASREDEGFLFGRLADLELRRGNTDRAREYLQRARDSAERHGGGAWESVFMLTMLSAVERQVGNAEEARRLHAEAMRNVTAAPVGHPAYGHLHAFLLGGSARFAIDDGDLDAAARHVREATEAAVTTRDMPVVAAVGVVRAELLAAHGDATGAAVLLGAAARLRGADDWSAPDIASITKRLRGELGDRQFDTCYAEGKALEREAALERLTKLD